VIWRGAGERKERRAMEAEKKIELNKFKAPFPSSEVEWRLKTAGKNGKGSWAMLLPYVTNRAIMNRLDEVAGPENWRNEFQPGPSGGTMCGLSIRINNEWITKWDGAQETDIEPVKGGYSDAMKRAAVQWGIGRYLYCLDFQVVDVVPDRPKTRFVRVDDQKRGVKGYAVIPDLPAWALPEENANKSTQEENQTEEEIPQTIAPSLNGITYRRKGNLIIAEGNTFAVKGTLKSAGFRWNAGEKAWAKAANA
jgi:hypothetical protein